MQAPIFKISPIDTDKRAKVKVVPGSTVRVHQKIQEKGKTRIQIFEGLVIAVKHGHEAGSTFTVRKVASGVGMEKIFPLYSPMIDKIEVVKQSKVRRSKLYYIRDKAAKEIRRRMKQVVGTKASVGDTDDEVAMEEEAIEPEVEVVTADQTEASSPQTLESADETETK